jgi:serine/threonine protein kinase
MDVGEPPHPSPAVELPYQPPLDVEPPWERRLGDVMSAQTFSRFHQSAPLPRKLYGYDVVGFLGEGAGSKIYVVSDPVRNKLLALKHVTRLHEKDIRFVEQLEAEFEVSKQFTHHGLRRTFDLKIEKTFLRRVTEAALIMEMFDGSALDVRPPQNLVAMMTVFIETAQALHALHGMGYVHCDLKPNNILIGDHLQVKVIDFGQACKAGTIKERIQGTPDYISPEQVRCEPLTARTDVFNFGATMYWGLTGRRIPTLFTLKRGENSFLVDQTIPSPHDVNARIPEQLSNLVMDCCRTRVEKRPGDMNEIARRLETMRHAIVRHGQPAQNQNQPSPSRSAVMA